MTDSAAYLARYQASLLGVFGTPALVLDHGQGCWVSDVEGRRYLDLIGGIAVNTLGHNHPALVEAITRQAAAAIHVSNFFTTPAQIELAEALLRIAQAPAGSGVFFANSGAEAIEAAIKLARRMGRTALVAADGAFHGRTTGALALTSKAAYRVPFEPLLPGVRHIPFGDVDALDAAVTEETAALFLEPIQGEAGVIPATANYLRAAREITAARGALLILDEIQSGMGRTGSWFAFQAADIVPDAITIAKGLGGGVPIGALLALGPEVATLLQPGGHGSTFGGNPLASAAGLAVITEIERADLRGHAVTVGEHLSERVAALRHPAVTGVRGVGLLRALTLDRDIAPAVAAAFRERGILVNPVAPNALRLAPPLIITTAELDNFVDHLPAALDAAGATKEHS